MMKRIGLVMGEVLVLPLLLRYLFLRAIVDPDRALSSVSEHAARRPGLFGLYARQALYRKLLRGVGSNVHFGYQTLLSKREACIGDGVYLGRFCTIGLVEIGEQTRIADGVQLLSGANHHGSSNRGVNLHAVEQAPIRIGKGVWIGANAVVMADVDDGAIVGAGAVVTRPVAAGSTVIGVPAKPVALRPSRPQAA